MKNSRLMLALVLVLSAAPALARPDLCEAAATRAARETGVPAEVLHAIALTETGRRVNGALRPWPWAANTEGRGHWFASREALAGFLRETLARGQRSIDLGCFQINLRWHGAQFPTPEALLDPLTGARYAARFLSELHAELGDWEAAAGAYHSRSPQLARHYRARFARMRALLRDPATTQAADSYPAPPAPPPAPPPTAGAYPLFAGRASGASLFPASLAAARPLIDLQP